MKTFYKSPLYLGLATMVIAILVSTVKLSQDRSVTNSVTQANQGISSLSLQFASPDTISLILDSPVDIGGIDITVTYNTGGVYILPSTLNSNIFQTSGGQLDQNTGRYSFTLFATQLPVKTGIIASFQVAPISEAVTPREVTMDIDQSKSAVYSQDGQINTLGVARGVKFTPVPESPTL